MSAEPTELLRPDDHPVHLRKGWEKGYTPVGPFKIRNMNLHHLSGLDLKITAAVGSYSYRKAEWWVSDQDLAAITGACTSTLQKWRKRIAPLFGIEVTVGDGRTATHYRLLDKGHGRVKVNQTAKRAARLKGPRDDKGRWYGGTTQDGKAERTGWSGDTTQDGTAVPLSADRGWYGGTIKEVSTSTKEVEEGSNPPSGGASLAPLVPDLAALGEPGSIKRVLATLPMSPQVRETWGRLAQERMADGALEADLLLVMDWGRSCAERQPHFKGNTNPKFLWDPERFTAHLLAARAWKRTEKTGGRLYEPEGRASNIDLSIHRHARFVAEGQMDVDDYMQDCRAEGLTPAEVHEKVEHARDRLEQRKLDEAARKAALPPPAPPKLPEPPKPDTWAERKTKTIRTLEARVDALFLPGDDLANDKVEWKRQCDEANAALKAAKARTREEWEHDLDHEQEDRS